MKFTLVAAIAALSPTASFARIKSNSDPIIPFGSVERELDDDVCPPKGRTCYNDYDCENSGKTTCDAYFNVCRDPANPPVTTVPDNYCPRYPYYRPNDIGPGETCYRITQEELFNPYGGCTSGYACSATSIWWGWKCEVIPYGVSVGPDPLAAIPDYISSSCAGTDYDTCPEISNLGPYLSGSGWYGEYPVINSVTDIILDSGISLLVKGMYTSEVAAEVEGKMVILGDVKINGNGAGDFVCAGVGSGARPDLNEVSLTGKYYGCQTSKNDPTPLCSHKDFLTFVCKTVGGDLFYNRYSNGHVCGKVAIGGLLKEEYSHGKLITDDEYSLSQYAYINKQYYLSMFDDLAKKSKYWATLYPNGIVVPALASSGSNVVTFKAGYDYGTYDYGCIQVFHIDHFDIGIGSDRVVNIQFDESLKDKTIVINVASRDIYGKREVHIPAWGDIIDPYGNGSTNFSPKMKRSILWNFYDADKVVLGEGGLGGPQFPGTILIPDGDLDFYWPGHGGRLIVGGDLYQERWGSEFHNYDFNPPCPLPLPPYYPLPPSCIDRIDGCPCDYDSDCEPKCDMYNYLCITKDESTPRDDDPECECEAPKSIPTTCEVDILIDLLEAAVVNDFSLFPKWLRASFHDAGTRNQMENVGGANGCLMNHPLMAQMEENANLAGPVAALEAVKNSWINHAETCIDISSADILQFGGLYASIRQSGSPGMTQAKRDDLKNFEWGRPDEENCEQNWTENLPGFALGQSGSMANRCQMARGEIKTKMMDRNGFTAKEANALSGAHSIGLVRNTFGPGLAGPWVTTGADNATPQGPVFGNAYHNFIVNTIEATTVNDFNTNRLPFNIPFSDWHRDGQDDLDHLDTDYCMAFPPLSGDSSPDFSDDAAGFANNPNQFLTEYFSAYDKMSKLGVDVALLSAPTGCDDSSCSTATNDDPFDTLHQGLITAYELGEQDRQYWLEYFEEFRIIQTTPIDVINID